MPEKQPFHQIVIEIVSGSNREAYSTLLERYELGGYAEPDYCFFAILCQMAIIPEAAKEQLARGFIEGLSEYSPIDPHTITACADLLLALGMTGLVKEILATKTKEDRLDLLRALVDEIGEIIIESVRNGKLSPEAASPLVTDLSLTDLLDNALGGENLDSEQRSRLCLLQELTASSGTDSAEKAET